MKKFTFLVILILFASFVIAQVNVNYKIVANKGDKIKTSVIAQKADPFWQCTFEEETPIWTIGSMSGVKTWAVSDTTPTYGFTHVNYENGQAEVPPSWLYMLRRYVHDYSPSGQNFAWISGIESLLNIGPFGDELSESYIQFDNINLTDVSNPKLTFWQNYKVFNSDECYIDFSTDGGTTWESVRINEKESLGGVNKPGEVYLEIIATNYIANAANVSIRFRWVVTDDDVDYGAGYGWQLDDIQIVETPIYDTKLVHGRMNFFEYGDYTDPAYADYNVYQLSGYYGNLPQAQFASEYANCWFNVATTNIGVEAITPVAIVEIFNPEMESIFTNNVTGNNLLTNETDTIDLIEIEFALGENPMLGEYTVVYTIEIDGQEDEVPVNNVDTSYFNITDIIYSRDVDEPSSAKSLNNSSLGGNDGEQFGQSFMFLWEGTIASVDVFIDEGTSVGTSFILNALRYDSNSGQYVNVGVSALNNITAADLGNWKNVEFSDDVTIEIDPEYGGTELLITLAMYYNGGDNEIWIGYDRYNYVDAVHNHGFYTKYVGDDTWYFGGLDGGLSMRVNMQAIVPVASFSADVTEGCGTLSVNFTDESTNNTTSWLWDFGDGNTSTEQNPSHTYSETGVYTVSFTATNINVSDTYIATDLVHIYANPIVNLGNDIEQCGGSVILDAGSGFESYVWNEIFGNQTLLVTESGTYTVVVEDINGCTATDQIEVIEYPLPSISLSMLEESSAGATDGSITVIPESGVLPFYYYWNNGAETAAITDLTAGLYCVTVSDDNGCSVTDCISVTIANQLNPPVADFTADVMLGCNTLTVQFDDMSLNNPTTWSWDFGDGNTSIEENPQHTYNVSGNYSVSLMVSNDDGISELEIKTDYITLGETPLLSITMTPESEIGASDGTASVSSSGGIGILSYLWDNSEENQEITNLTAGTYCVTVVDEAGCSAEDCIEVSVIGNNYVMFAADVTNGCVPHEVQFTDQSTGNILSWTWNFGDGGNSVEQNPTHTYQTSGIYTVSLTVIYAYGIDTHTEENYIEVNEIPELSFEISDESLAGAADGVIVLTITGGEAPYIINWSNNAHTETITELNAGIYSVVVIDANDCVAVDNATVDIYTNIVGAVTDEVKIYPNPAKDVLNVVSPSKIISIGIYDITGKLIIKKHETEKYCEINIQELQSGAYIIYVQNNENNIIRRFVKH